MGTGSLHATIGILEMYKEKQGTLNTLEKAFGQVMHTAKTLAPDSHNWNEHQMAVHAIRKDIVRKVQSGCFLATDDIPPVAYYHESDAWLLVSYLDVDKVPAGMCSLIILSLIEHDDEKAQQFFAQTWVRSVPVQEGICQDIIPIELFEEVRARDHGKARLLMLRMLEKYEEHTDKLLARLLGVLLGPPGSPARHIGNDEIKPEMPLLASIMRHAVARGSPELMECAERLFVNIFLANDGFQGDWGRNGDLPIEMLKNIVKTEDSLQLVRKAVLEHNEKDPSHSVEDISRMWEYCHWPLCHDEKIIQRGMDFLAGRCVGKSTQEQAEVFSLFTKLQFWRLPSSSFMSPYVPAPLLTSHVVAMYRRLVDEVQQLQKAHVQNLSEINALRTTVQEMSARLEQTDQRSQNALKRLQH